jgi:hypothetical protein
MPEFTSLLRHNRNYRHTWLGQVVSEKGDYFNNIAVFSLVMAVTGSGLVVSGVMLSRATPAMLAGPVAGVALDRFDCRRIIGSERVVAHPHGPQDAVMWSLCPQLDCLAGVIIATCIIPTPMPWSVRSPGPALLPSGPRKFPPHSFQPPARNAPRVS